MIWHIFKKDFRLWWPLAALVAALQFAYVVLLWLKPLARGGFGGGPAGVVTDLTAGVLLLSAVFLIAAIAHQETIPGVRQDWLIRPIPRGQLLLAKLLSVLVMAHVPMLVTDLIYHVVGNGVPMARALEVALSRNVFVFLVISVPLLAFLSLVRNIMEAVAAAVVLALSVALFAVLTRGLHWQLALVFDPASETGLVWVSETLGYAVGVIGAIAVLCVQYFRRKTRLAGALTAVIWVLFGLAVSFLPWKSAFAIEERLSSRPGAGSAVELSFDPGIGKFSRNPKYPSEIDQTWRLPIRLAGLPPDSVLRADLTITRAVAKTGELLPISIDKNLDFYENGPAHLRIGLEPLSGDPWQNVFNEPTYPPGGGVFPKPLNLEIELSMTLFRLAASSETAPLSRLRPPGARCAYHGSEASSGWDDPLEAELSLNCSPVVKLPPCFVLVLKDIPSPYALRPFMKCSRDYRPYSGRLLPGGEEINATAFLRDPAGQVHYPDGLDDILGIHAALQFYEPVDHFTRKLTITGVQVKDWISRRPPEAGVPPKPNQL